MNKEIEEKLNLINEELKDLKLHLVPKEEVEGVVCSNVTNEDIPFILEQIPDMNKIVTGVRYGVRDKNSECYCGVDFYN